MPKKRSTEPGPAPAKGAGRPAREPRELKALFAALESNPGDAITLLALADWYEEAGGAKAAECLRWLADKGKTPYRYRHDEKLQHHHDTWQDGWYWWTTAREKRGWGYPDTAALPHKQWEALANMFNYPPVVFKEYPTVRGAVEALMTVWDPKLIAARKKRRSS